ncbi:metal-sensitive transcriptional regulator [Methyloceanibacter sp.]|uniref:metal-sensitive transcriptional regulator n=1 Tax=Methyloceanibacter sp. TaxID=1965321 RepID=UPI002D1D5932|nr:metal-sensitive transcriptional regulator [Methyloceanibacter sp.]HML90841.1 metal-sensitive transcriptional regulator [Methyloceanibacter sp.]
MTPRTQKNARARLARIEGQVRGLARMIADDRYCIDVITQTQAVRAALARVERLVLQDHVEHCVADAVASGDKAERERKIEELISVLKGAT